MEEPNGNAARKDYPKLLWEAASTLTENAQSAAIRKARELEYDLSAGEISIDETLINLSTARDVLLDTVQKGRLVQLPLRLQARLLQETLKVSQTLNEIINGKDAIRILENSVEELNATIWQLNLQNQAESVLGFERKMNELKAQEVIVKRSMLRATRLTKRVDEIEDLLKQMSDAHNSVISHSEETDTAATAARNLVGEVEQASAKAQGILTVAREYETSLSQSAAAARAASSEIEVLLQEAEERRDEISEIKQSFASIQDELAGFLAKSETDMQTRLDTLIEKEDAFEKQISSAIDALNAQSETDLGSAIEDFGEKTAALLEDTNSKIEDIATAAESAEKSRNQVAKEQLEELTTEYDASFKKLSEDSRELLENHAQETKNITDRLNELEDRIRDAIERATGYTLFHSFQKRQEDLHKSTRFWIWALAICVITSLGITGYLIHQIPNLHEYRIAFYVKLSLALPLVFALTFCSLQYTRERRLEEEYAFKSNISISLDPYQRLVSTLVNNADESERAKYTAFIIESINRVFTSPTGLVFDIEDEEKGVNTLLKTAGGVAKDLIKAKHG